MNRIVFFTFGDQSTASSRLRAFLLGSALERMGLEVEYNPDDFTGADITVFQKVRRHDDLEIALQGNSLTVFDFDDNYLDPSVGVLDELVRFLNRTDVVTVGSADLLQEAQRYHRRVWLFDNPLDLEATSEPKESYGGERIGWFGHPSNLYTLEDLDIARPVETLTRGGDIEWSADTVDQNLIRFDLVLVPVQLGAWTASKNANRALKSIGLGVPVLASATPEHRRAFELVGLDERFLVEPGADWDASINRVLSLDGLPEIMGRAREKAWEHYGVDNVAVQWLETVTALKRHPAVSPRTYNSGRPRPRVFVLHDSPQSPIEPTLRSIKACGVSEDEITLVRLPSPAVAPPSVEFPAVHEEVSGSDYFAVYGALAGAVNDGALSGPAMIVRAGAEVLPYALEELESVGDTGVVILRSQYDGPRVPQMVDTAPTALLLSRPAVFDAVVFGSDSLSVVGGLDGGMLHWGLWDFVASAAVAGLEVRSSPVPGVLVPDSFALFNPMSNYQDYLGVVDPVIARDLPNLNAENERLEQLLFAKAVHKHRDVYASSLASIVADLRSAGRLVDARRADSALLAGRRRLDLEQGSRDAKAGEPVLPEMVRRTDGRVYVVGERTRRHVTSAVLASAMESAWGQIIDIPDTDARLEIPEGEPIRVFAAEGRPFVIVDGRRYKVRGLPVPYLVNPAALGRFPLAEQKIDVGKAHASRVRLREAERRIEALNGRQQELIRSRDKKEEALARLKNRRSVRLALRAADGLGRVRKVFRR